MLAIGKSFTLLVGPQETYILKFPFKRIMRLKKPQNEYD